MNGYAAILQGLYERERTGKGSGYKVSMFDTMAEIMNVPFIQTKYSDNVVKRVGLKHPSIAPYGAFTAMDERKILISIQNEREWVNLCAKVLGDAALATDSRFSTATDRVVNRPALDAIVQEAFGKQKADDLTALLLSAGIAFGELNSVKGLVEHPQLRTVEYKTEQGKSIEVPAPAVQPSPPSLRDVPRLGEHDEIIREEISQL
ncbi:CaiB/baiF CoA-transferase family protein DDB_G0269880 [Hondaea fermentalgiana]|uniref:CaiB/baiF CoA-transferase family protein DDB_G0269880 n=1 Tax=Hondaea fermentalgiana TaxID=2315210 RepID=A0A2R5FYP0_9STRA|nr:CaiB/baiF CoA-transferase family protein DDB_G0269880 [Hondaea fermentalgiana]|eukprot:GBG23872.1 CaiB/baiF CoA-transferase family protein DDB_G0269880 [Hondaea fermentalgiana]